MKISSHILAFCIVSTYAHGFGSFSLQQHINRLPIADHAATLKSLIGDLQHQYAKEQGQQLLSSLAHIPVKETPAHALLSDQLKRCQLLHEAVKKHCTQPGTSDPFLRQLLCDALEHERTLLCTQTDDERTDNLEKIWDLYHHAVHEDFSQKVSPQGFIMGIILTILVTSGGQAAEKLINKEEQAKLKDLFAKVKAIQKAFKAKEAQLNKNTKATIATLGKNFNTRVSKIKKTLGDAQNQLQQEIRYIQRLVNVSTTPLPFFIPGQTILIDQQFGASPMNTPKNGYTWHNVWGATSDWAFDPKSGGFIQRGIQPGSQGGFIVNQLGKQLMGSDGKADASMAELNCIFTEYFTTKQPYTLEFELTLFNNAFPFCAAVIFNKPRWLSGNPDRMYSYRFVGIYGDSSNNIGIYAGQSVSKKSAGIAVTTTPLKGIIGNTDPSVFKKLYTFKPNELPAFGKQPITYVISIETQESQFNVTITKKGEKQPLVTSPVSFNDPTMNTLLSWYAGIGFMAPGCQALFKINKPTELTYTKAQLNAFKTQQAKTKREVSK